MSSFMFFTMIMIQSISTSGQSPAQQIHRVMAEIYPENAPGAALLVVKNDSVIISEGFGMAYLLEKIKISPYTNFRMASVSKQFTSYCILLLVHQKKIGLEDPITDYLAGLPPFAKSISINHLLTHSSGLADYESQIPPSRTTQVSDADVLDIIRGSESLYFKPGTRFRYSNTGYCLLTQIIESVSGIPYPEFIREHIFETLKMQKSTIMQQGQPIAHRAFGYHSAEDAWQFADQSITSATMGDGCVYTSLNDYARWIRALWNEQLLSPEDKANPLLPHVKVTEKLSYGFGWFIMNAPNGKGKYIFHTGESTGFHNIVFQHPGEGLLIVIFSNSDDERISRAFDRITSVLDIQWPEFMRGISLFPYLHSVYEP